MWGGSAGVGRRRRGGGGGGSPPQTSPRLAELREQLEKINVEIAELLGLGAKMDGTKFAAAQTKRDELEAEIKKLEEADEQPTVRPEAEELEQFLAEVSASALLAEKKDEIQAIGVLDLAEAKALFATAMAAVTLVKPEPEPPTTLEQLKTRVEQANLGAGMKAAIIKAAESNLAKGLGAFGKWAMK